MFAPFGNPGKDYRNPVLSLRCTCVVIWGAKLSSRRAVRMEVRTQIRRTAVHAGSSGLRAKKQHTQALCMFLGVQQE
eukprot:4056999-Alexandrium_andersonii.AAC.1